MKFSTKNYLFYYCYVNLHYCVVRATFNLSIYRMDRYGIQIQSSVRHCFMSMEIPTVRVRQCILEAKGIVPLPLTLFMEDHNDKNIDGSCPSVYSKDEGNCSPPLGTIHGTSHRWKY